MTRTLALALLLALLTACAGSFRTQASRVSNIAADTIDVATRTLLGRYCERSMAALGRSGVLHDDSTRPAGVRCEAGGPNASAVATAEQRGALAGVQASWRPVLDAAEAVVQAQRVVAGTLRATSAAGDGALLRALGELAAAYEALRNIATAAGVPPPPALTLDATTGGR